LEVIKELGDEYRVVALTAHTDHQFLAEQVHRFQPELAVLTETGADTQSFKHEMSNLDVQVEQGEEGLLQAATWPTADIILIAVVGFSGFRPVLSALKAGKKVALANKESLVVGGELLAREYPAYQEQVIPVDSEHSAIFQCLQGENPESIRKVFLTASGGPFRGWKFHELHHVTREQALKHPNWQMGSKITIDSATLMNKGFEVLEAQWLFNVPLQKIGVLIHPQSLVHGMVEFTDGSVIAQVAPPDMRLPIQYALTFPRRRDSLIAPVNWNEQNLVFEPPDTETFPCLSYAYQAGEVGGSMPACMNAANEVAVELFLQGQIMFSAISELIRKVMARHELVKRPAEEDILAVDGWARDKTLELFKAGDY